MNSTTGYVTGYNGRMIRPQDQRGRNAIPPTADNPESVIVSPGQVINCEVEPATDNDKLVVTQNGQTTTTYPFDEPITYRWSVERNGVQVGGFANPTVASTTWTAPTVEGSYTLKCALDDPWIGGQTGVGANEGDRNDKKNSGEPPVVRSVRVDVARVRFVEDKNQTYGFDDFTYPETPSKSLAQNTTDTAIARFMVDAASIGGVFFTSQSPTIVDINPQQAATSPQTVTLSAGSLPDKTTSLTTTLNARTGTSAGPIAATMNGYVYDWKTRSVLIILVHEENDDVQTIAVGGGGGTPNQICVSAGTNGFRDTVPNRKADGTIDPMGDDAVSADDKSITTGANGICETTANSSNVESRDADRAAIESFLQRTYKQAVFGWVVESRVAKTVNFDLNRDGKLDINYPINNGWTNEQRAIIDACKVDSIHHNIFLVQMPRSTPVAGMNTIGGKYGFVFTWPIVPGAYDMNLGVSRTFAHEVGHGLTLQHRNEDDLNIMVQSRYAQQPRENSNRLRVNQWNQIQSALPAFVD